MRKLKMWGAAQAAILVLATLSACATVSNRVELDAEANSKARCDAATNHDARVAIMVDVRRVRAAYDRVKGAPSDALIAARIATDAACAA